MNPDRHRSNRHILPCFPSACALAMLITCSLAPAQTQPTTQPAAPRPALLATGSPDRFWIAQSDTHSKTRVRTLLRGQILPAGDWQDLGPALGAVASMADMRGELALLFDDQTWKRIGATGVVSSGLSIPGSGPVLAWGGTSQALLAIRDVEGGKSALPEPVQTPPDPDVFAKPVTRPAATRPSTTQASTAPTTRSVSPPRPVLFQFERGQWKAVADVPASATSTMALGSLDHRPVLAVSSGQQIQTYAWIDAHWVDWGKVNAGTGRFQLSGAPTFCVLWAIDPDGSSKVWRQLGKGWEPITLAQTAADAIPQRTFAVAGNELRLVVLKDGAVWEQRYEVTGEKAGAVRGGLTQLASPHSNQPNPFAWLFQAFLFTLFITVIVIVLYRRRQAAPTEKNEDEN